VELEDFLDKQLAAKDQSVGKVTHSKPEQLAER
jgi:hypothetical protein